MFERFTDRARRVVVLAQEEARLLNHNYIGTEHLLLGLIHEQQGVAAKALESLGVSLEAVRAQVEEIIGQGQRAPTGHIPFTPRAKKVLELSLRESKQLGHNYIGTEHILLGLVREGEGVAAQVLVKLGADLSRVRQQVVQLLSGSAGGPEAAAGTPLVPMGMPVPDELREAGEQLAEVRRQKEAAIEAQDFDRAAALRDAEEELLAGLAEREREWTAGVDLAAVVQEVQRLHGEVQRLHGEVQGLRELLRRHGIQPDGGTAQPA
jgi:ATP-dependent Clp protease ATP-binding subunit ClpA